MDEFNQEKLKEKFQKEYEELKNSLKKPNILLIGQTGVGKSSLINTVFGDDIAKVSNTKPETRGFYKYYDKELPINVIDSEGYELLKADTFKSDLSTYIDSNIHDINEQIHIAWYCISISGARVLPYDIDNIKFIFEEKKIPTAVVLTQADSDSPEGDTAKAMISEIEKYFGSKISCFQVSNDKHLNEDVLDVENLVNWSIENISDDNVKKAFIIAQRSNLKAKFKQSHAVVAAAATAAAGAGASPIPLSDAAVLIPIQVTMAARIFHIYGLNYGLGNTLKDLIGSRVISVLGKAAAGNLLKMFPGIGSLAGGLINAAVASAMTYSLGFGLIKVAELIVEKQLDGTFNEEFLKNILTSENLESFIKQYEESKAKKNA